MHAGDVYSFVWSGGRRGRGGGASRFASRPDMAVSVEIVMYAEHVEEIEETEEEEGYSGDAQA